VLALLEPPKLLSELFQIIRSDAPTIISDDSCSLVNLQTQRWQEAKQAEAAYCA
jgi:hypothetical protein